MSFMGSLQRQNEELDGHDGDFRAQDDPTDRDHPWRDRHLASVPGTKPYTEFGFAESWFFPDGFLISNAKLPISDTIRLESGICDSVRLRPTGRARKRAIRHSSR